jgi:hypothetical protein
MAYDSVRNVAVLFGGTNGENSYLGETWEWNGAGWTQRPISGPAARAFHSMTFDTTRGVTVLHGGKTAQGITSETWEYNGAAWSLRTSSGPVRQHHNLVYAGGRTILVGGEDSTGYVTGTWEWDGSNWTQRAGANPRGRDAAAAAFDGGRNVLVLHGGFEYSYSPDTWELPMAGPAITQQPSGATAAAGASVQFSVQASGAQGYQWRKGGVALSDGGNISGAMSATLTIEPVSSGDAGSYDVIVSNSCGATPSNAVTLSVGTSCYANCDGSTTPPVLNVADFGCFLQKFAAGDLYANCDGSTTPPVLNVADFGCFLQKFAAGCP